MTHHAALYTSLVTAASGNLNADQSGLIDGTVILIEWTTQNEYHVTWAHMPREATALGAAFAELETVHATMVKRVESAANAH